MAITDQTKHRLPNATKEEQHVWSAIHDLAVYLELPVKREVMLARALAHLHQSGLMPQIELAGEIVRIANEPNN